jgi:hypothetical protein
MLPPDHQGAAVRHRVAGVDRQVDQDLLHTSTVGVDHQPVRRRSGDQGDVRTDRAGEQVMRIGDRRVHVEQLRTDDVLPGERQQLPGQFDGAFGGQPER